MSLFRRHKKFEEQLNEQLGDMEYKPSESLWDRIDSGISSDGFEKDVRGKLDQFEQMPSSSTWKRIEAQLPTEKQPSLKRYWLASALAVFSAVAITWVTRNDVPAPTPSASLTEETAPAPERTRNIVEPKEETVNKRTPRAPLNVVAPQTAALPIGETKSERTVRTTSVEQPTATRQPQNNNRDRQQIAYKQPETIASTIATSTPAETPVAPTVTDIKEDIQPQSMPVKAEQEPVVLAQEPVSAATEDIRQEKDPGKVKVAAEVLVPTALTPTILSAKEVGSLNTDSMNYANRQALLKDPSSTGDEPGAFSLSIFAGAHMSYSTYDQPANSSLNFDNNIALRKQLERPAIDWAGGFMLDYRLNDKWMVSSGLMMVNFNQQFDYSTQTAVNPAKSSEVGALVSNVSDSFMVGNQYSNRIKYSWNEIPLYINYRLWDHRRVRIDLQGGVSYAFINTIDAGIISYDNKGVLVVKDKEAFPQISNAFFATVQPQVSYAFGETVSVGLVPTFKYSLNSIIGNERWIQQHPYFIGLSACLRKRF